MQISLSPELEQFVNEQVTSGRYQTANEVVSVTLDSLRQTEQWSAEDMAELRRDIRVGIDELDNGEVEEWDAEQIKKEGRRLLAAKPRKGE